MSAMLISRSYSLSHMFFGSTQDPSLPDSKVGRTGPFVKNVIFEALNPKMTTAGFGLA